MTLPEFPTDPETLDLLSTALSPVRCPACGSEPTDGPGVCPHCEGRAGTSLTGTLDLLSGYDPDDPSKFRPAHDGDGRVMPDTREYVGGPIYVVEDVVRSLIAEVRRLRRLRPNPFPEPTPTFARSGRSAPFTHPYRLVALSAAVGALCGAVVGWWAAGRGGQ